MKFLRNATIVISEDDNTDPQFIRFKETRETIDNGKECLLKDGGGTTITIDANVVDFQLPITGFVNGKYLYLYGDVAFTLKLGDGSSLAMSMLAKKPNELWHTFTTPPLITTGTEALRLTFAIAGD